MQSISRLIILEIEIIYKYLPICSVLMQKLVTISIQKRKGLTI